MPAQATRPAGSKPEGGIATVWTVSWILVCLSVGMVAMLAAAITARQHHLDGAADLVAVSAAGRLERGGDACRLAAEIARANEVDLAWCRIQGGDVMVTVVDDMRLPLGVDGAMTASARAGP